MTELFEVITKDEFEKSSAFRSNGTSALNEGSGVGNDPVMGAEQLSGAMGQAATPNDLPDLAPETFTCDFCGHCETPNDCAWAHECPICHAPAGRISMTTYCKTPTGGIVGLHAERWNVA